MSGGIRQLWENDLRLSTSDQIEAEETYLLDQFERGNAHKPDIKVRWQRLIVAKERLIQSFNPPQPTPSIPNTNIKNIEGAGCRSCQSDPCSCEKGVKRK